MLDKLAVQMYTLRDHTTTAADLATTLQRIAAMGYPAVQLSAVACMNGEAPEVSAAAAKQMLDDNGLRCIATHRSWDDLTTKLDQEIAFHKTLDCDYAAIGGIPSPRYETTYDGYRRWIDDARPIIEGLKAEGIRFGHHNHSKEFYRPERHGKTLEDILIEEGGADLMMELDLYWVAHAGVSPERIMERCRGRVPVIHIKDKEPLPDSNDCIIAAIGEGVMEWDHIIPACEAAGVDWYAIEQDTCPRDPFDCLQSSIDYIRNRGFGAVAA
jgi:sugar phosphate isomerase/epimerase